MNTLLYLIVCHKAFKYTHFNILVLVEIQLFALYNCLTQLTHEYMHCQQQIQVKTLFLCRAQNGSALVVVIWRPLKADSLNLSKVQAVTNQGWREVVNSALHERNYTDLRHTTYVLTPSRKEPLSWGYNILKTIVVNWYQLIFLKDLKQHILPYRAAGWACKMTFPFSTLFILCQQANYASRQNPNSLCMCIP